MVGWRSLAVAMACSLSLGRPWLGCITQQVFCKNTQRCKASILLSYAHTMARTRLTKNLETSMPLRQIIWAFLLIFLFSLTNSTASGQEQPSTAWQNIQRLLRSNGYTGVRETGNRSDCASNLALRLFCRNLDCNKYEKSNLTPEEKLAAWTFVLEEGLRRRLSGNYAVIELA